MHFIAFQLAFHLKYVKERALPATVILWLQSFFLIRKNESRRLRDNCMLLKSTNRLAHMILFIVCYRRCRSHCPWKSCWLHVLSYKVYILHTYACMPPVYVHKIFSQYDIFFKWQPFFFNFPANCSHAYPVSHRTFTFNIDLHMFLVYAHIKNQVTMT